MKLLNSLTVKMKLGILFSILLITFAFYGANTLASSKNIANHDNINLKIDHVFYKFQNEVVLLYKLKKNIEEYILFRNNEEILIKIKQQTKELENVFSNSEDKINYKLWAECKKQIHLLLEINKIESSKETINFYETIDIKFSDLMDNLIMQNEQYINEIRILDIEARKESHYIKDSASVFTIIILFISVFIGWIVSNNIINSIKKIQIGLKEFFDFLNHKNKRMKKIDLENDSEFSQMANDININIDKIQDDITKDIRLINEATSLLKSVKQGDLEQRLVSNTNNKQLNDLKFMMNSMLDDLETKIKEEINKRIEKEQLLTHQSKLAAMGEMIGNIAHQWRQPISQISAILLNIQVRQQFNKCSKEYFDEKVAEASTLAEYMSQTITDFQNFFKPESAKTVFSIKQACIDAQLIIAPTIKYNKIELTFEGDEDCEVNGYKSEYSQVVLNMLNNARDALIEKKIKNPKITITIKNGYNYGLVKIQDNAGGIPENIIKNIFEPYFTTKHKSKGTGIGLYMSKNIIENNMSGFIKIDNINSGACFTIKVMK